MAANLTAGFRLKEKSVIKFFEIIQECVIYAKKHFLLKKYLQMG